MNHTEICVYLVEKLGRRSFNEMIPYLSDELVVCHPAVPEITANNREEYLELLKGFFGWALEGKIEVFAHS